MTKPVEHIDLIQDRPVAITEAKLDEIQALIELWMNGVKPDVPDAASGKSGNRAADNFEVRNGVAIIPVYGTIAKKMNFFMRYSGGTSTELLQRDIGKALSMKKVKAILLDIDSPGGSVDGISTISDFIFENRGKKPIIAFCNGTTCSAAYWIASAADQLITTDVSLVGSIGVFMVHYDVSENDKKWGIKRTPVSAGKYKTITSDEKPLSKEGREYLQDQVDYYYSLFVDAVARNRGVDPQTVLEKMADGKLFIGERALKAGLVDTMGTYELAFKIARTKGVSSMNYQEFKAEHPDLFKKVYDEGVNSVQVEKVDVDAIKTTASSEATKAERERVSAILGVETAPIEARIEAVKDGKSPDQAYKLFWEKQQEDIKNDTDALTDVPKPAAHDAQEQGDPSERNIKDFMAVAKEVQKEKGFKTLTEAMTFVSKTDPDLHEAFVKSQGAKQKSKSE